MAQPGEECAFEAGAGDAGIAAELGGEGHFVGDFGAADLDGGEDLGGEGGLFGHGGAIGKLVFGIPGFSNDFVFGFLGADGDVFGFGCPTFVGVVFLHLIPTGQGCGE